MARDLLKSPLIISYIHFLLLPLLIFQSSADTPPLQPTPPSTTICNITPYPSFCNTILQTFNSSSNIYDYTRFSFRKSLSSARISLSLIQKYLNNPKTLTITTVRALKDCKFLAQCNIDNLITSFQIVTQTSQNVSIHKVDDIQTLLSAILTNTETCIDGLKASASSALIIRNDILSRLSIDTRLYSVSLALFTTGWVPKGKKMQSHGNASFIRNNGKLYLKMSARNQRIYNRAANNNNNNNIRIVQTDDGTNHDEAIFVRDIVTVSGNGSSNIYSSMKISGNGSSSYSSIKSAVAAAPYNANETSGYFVIYVTAGVYDEYLSIPRTKKYVMMIGDGINQTIITGNRSVADGSTTFSSSTFAVDGTGFTAFGITFRNTAGPSKNQAVAVRNSADRSTFYACSFEAYQDTLNVHSLRQFYVGCDIYGTIDFIFGNAAVVFQSCNIYPRLPMASQYNVITAQGRADPNEKTGISFHNCTIRAADDLANSNITIQTYLGRPWKEYSRTVYMQSFMDGSISPAGWSIWSGDFALNTSYCAEFNNSGPGSDTGRRVTWPGFHVINATDAVNFTVSAFLNGTDWIPKTGAPYTGGLIYDDQ